MTRRSHVALAAVAFLLGACATKLERPVEPFASKVIEIAPNAWYERCLKLQSGDKLLFSYVVDPPMSFSLLRRVGTASLSYVLRDAAREEGGIFFVPESQEYCLHWTPLPVEVSWPTLLRFDVRLNP